MEEYHKIQSIFKRDEQTHKFIEGKWSLPEFEYLKDNLWVMTEKIDGTNIRVAWEEKPSGEYELRFGGRTDNAQIPTFLLSKLQDLFSDFDWAGQFPDGVTLYGEGYGAKIQKGGGNYIPDGVDFILFDVKIGSWWLRREDVEGIADKIGVKCVPIVCRGTIAEAIDIVKDGLKSTFGEFTAEGLVLKPEIDLFTRSGYRIVTKLKGKDF